jgi:hypothetical protein
VVTGKIPLISIVDKDVLLELGGPIKEKVNTDPSLFITVISVVTTTGIINPSPELKIKVSPAESIMVIILGEPNNKVGLKLPSRGETIGENIKTELLPLIRVISIVTAIEILANRSKRQEFVS